MQEVYKQKYYHSCLVTSLLMASGLDQKFEEKIFDLGEKQTDYKFYIDSIMASFNKVTGLKIVCLVDNKFLTEIFQKSLYKHKDEIEVKCQSVSADLVAKFVENHPVVVHLDDNYLGDYSHCSHFVVVNKIRKDGRFEILDPWDAKKKYLTHEQLDNAFKSLKTYIKNGAGNHFCKSCVINFCIVVY